MHNHVSYPQAYLRAAVSANKYASETGHEQRARWLLRAVIRKSTKYGSIRSVMEVLRTRRLYHFPLHGQDQEPQQRARLDGSRMQHRCNPLP